ncbi:hypothetical protein DV707_16650 (plasmid) [Halobellus limi]|uniref:Uncharacterized protein n=1 Tax=Halobellus limi TaxID=699433 RepID=A0A4D6H7V9_9EURY|nr:hypothetical protein DV707_16650 [Halobellus limi]
MTVTYWTPASIHRWAIDGPVRVRATADVSVDSLLTDFSHQFFHSLVTYLAGNLERLALAVGPGEEYTGSLGFYDLLDVVVPPFPFDVDDDGHRLVLLVSVVEIAGVPAGSDVRWGATFADRIEPGVVDGHLCLLSRVSI